MKKDIKNIIENDIDLDENSIWILPDQKKFQYSDGVVLENYLKRVFLSANDLSSNSYELESWIKDWPSEYHLSRKRAQLLRGFDFDKSKKVLEVGCGCGAITRFLGETFDDVVAIEGSIKRAELARLRTKGMDNVSIICAPFQKIKFKCHFDVIFCIGVFEYSTMFVDANDAHDYILKYFHDLLTPEGVVIIAIENQFGLKYFSSSKEDHTGIMFDGLEGYPSYGARKARTFGYGELKQLLSQHFRCVDFYFPYPDYKTPSCILSDRFFCKAKAGELIGRFKPNPYLANGKSLYDERLVLLELDKNNMLPFFSNSFLIIAGKQDISSIKFKFLGLVYSKNRVEKFQTVSSFIGHDDGRILVEKTPMNSQVEKESLFIRLHKCQSRWIEGLSIHTQIMRRVKENNLTIEEIFAPCKIWLRTITSLSSDKDNKLLLDGKYIDCLMSNSFIIDGECKFVDLEWEWHEKINIKILLIRCLYVFLNDISTMKDLNKVLNVNSMRCLIKKISRSLGVVLSKEDFKEFCKIEAWLSQSVYGGNFIRLRLTIKLILWNRGVYLFLASGVALFKKLIQKAKNLPARLSHALSLK